MINSTINPIMDGGVFLPLQTDFPKYFENCAGGRPALFYMWLEISPTHPVKNSARYKYEIFYDFSQKDGWH